MAYLIRKKVDGSVADRWKLGEKELVVGRGDQVHARTADAEMSRQHFKITFKDGQHQLQDLQSRNGTYVNGQRVSEATLKANDQIRSGETLFVFSADEGGEEMRTITGLHKPKLLKKG